MQPEYLASPNVQQGGNRQQRIVNKMRARGFEIVTILRAGVIMNRTREGMKKELLISRDGKLVGIIA